MSVASWLAELRGGLAARPLMAALNAPERHQRELLARVLLENASTCFGLEHDFGSIGDYDTYRQRVPIRDYEEHRPWVNALLAGGHQQLTREDPMMFGTTSGTTSEPKLVPVTPSWRKQIAAIQRIWIARASRDHPTMFSHKVLTMLSPAVEGQTECGTPIGSISGEAGRRVPWIIRRRYALPYEVCEIEDYDVRYRLSVRLAMAQSVSCLVTPNPATLVRISDTGRTHGATFIEHIRQGILGVDSADLSDSERGILRDIQQGLRPDPHRADYLQRLLDEHGELLPRHYWPDLTFIGCWLGGSAGIQARALSALYGDVPMRDLGFRATEATFTLPMYDGTPDGVLTLHANFFEFIPVDEIDDPDPTCLLAHEVVEGKQYYIITTTFGGLYRYDINDIVEVTGRYRNAPTIRFIRKGRDMVSIIGEKLHVNQLLEAAWEATEQTGVAWSQFRFIPDVEASRYDLLFEPTRADAGDEELRRFVHAFDESLCEVNMEYPTKRKSGRLHLPRLFVMNPGWAERVVRTDVMEQGRRDSQYKWCYIQQAWDERTRAEVHRTVEVDA